MVAGLLHPLSIYVLALGSGFLIPLLFRARAGLAVALFVLALAGMTLIPAFGFVALLQGGPTIEILTAGVAPPFAINLRFGLAESLFVLGVNLAGLLAAWHSLARLRESPAAMLLCIILIMGIDGMVMTRDLFNLFIFIEITALATDARGLVATEAAQALPARANDALQSLTEILTDLRKIDAQDPFVSEVEERILAEAHGRAPLTQPGELGVEAVSTPDELTGLVVNGAMGSPGAAGEDRKNIGGAVGTPGPSCSTTGGKRNSGVIGVRGQSGPGGSRPLQGAQAAAGAAGGDDSAPPRPPPLGTPGSWTRARRPPVGGGRPR